MKEVYSTETGARIDPWKEIANLREQLAAWQARAEALSEALQDAANKLSLYRAQHSGEYVGGMEYQALMRKINAAQAAQNAAGQEKDQPTDPRRQNPVRLPQAGTTPPAPAAPASGPSEAPCRHEWYQGTCAHCKIDADDYRASLRLAGRDK